MLHGWYLPAVWRCAAVAGWLSSHKYSWLILPTASCHCDSRCSSSSSSSSSSSISLIWSDGIGLSGNTLLQFRGPLKANQVSLLHFTALMFVSTSLCTLWVLRFPGALMVIPHKIRLLRNHSIILGELRVRTRRHQSLLGAPLGNFPWWPVHGINLVFTTNAKYMPVHETQCNIARRVVHSTQVEWCRRCLESLNVWCRWQTHVGWYRY